MTLSPFTASDTGIYGSLKVLPLTCSMQEILGLLVYRTRQNSAFDRAFASPDFTIISITLLSKQCKLLLKIANTNYG